MLEGTLTMEPVVDRSPNRNCWMLFKVASFDHVESLQNGLIYMNSLAYFSKFSGEENTALRRDDFEQTYLSLSSGSDGTIVRELLIEIDGKEFILGPESTMTVNLPDPSEIMVFCFACLADSPNGLIAGEVNGEVTLSERFSEFGSHALRIDNTPEFVKRLNNAITEHSGLYSSPFLEGGCGQVDYIDVANHHGPLGVFRKPIDFAWQREYRICLGAHTKSHNTWGALELNIGSIADISTIMTVEQLTTPISFTRRSYRVNAESGNIAQCTSPTNKISN